MNCVIIRHNQLAYQTHTIYRWIWPDFEVLKPDLAVKVVTNNVCRVYNSKDSTGIESNLLNL